MGSRWDSSSKIMFLCSKVTVRDLLGRAIVSINMENLAFGVELKFQNERRVSRCASF
jgi:hypothetical protein